MSITWGIFYLDEENKPKLIEFELKMHSENKCSLRMPCVMHN